MVDVIIDTSVLVEHLRGRPLLNRVEEIVGDAVVAMAHPVCVAELVEGARNAAEPRDVEDLCGAMRFVECASVDLAHGISSLKRLRLRHGLDWHDCVIATTAVRLCVPVATRNYKHFRLFAGLRIVRLP